MGAIAMGAGEERAEVTVTSMVGKPTFVGAAWCDDLTQLSADLAVIGVPYGVPYGMEGSTSPSSTAPAAIRAQSQRIGRYLSHFDFDLDAPLMPDPCPVIVDCGDVAMRPGRFAENAAATTRVIETILARGAVPVVLGGDHAIPIPVMRAYERFGPIFIVQVDAHLDWRDEVDGEHQGLSSPMRRASEMPWVTGMAQLGLRGVGMGRAIEVEAARAYGSRLVTASEIRRAGIEAVLAGIPAAERYYITIDADGIDPAIAPGVGSPAFGGLSYPETAGLLRGLAAKGRIVGVDLVEIVPARDPFGLTSILGTRLLVDVMSAMAHQGQFGPR